MNPRLAKLLWCEGRRQHNRLAFLSCNFFFCFSEQPENSFCYIFLMLGDLPYQVQPLPGSYQASRSAASSWQTPSSDARGGRTLDSSSKSNGSFIKNFTPYQVPYTSLTNRKYLIPFIFQTTSRAIDSAHFNRAARYAKGVAQKAESIRPLTVSYRTNTDFGRR